MVPPPRLRYSAADRTCRRRLKNTSQRIIPSRSHFEAGRVLYQSSKEPARCLDRLQRKLPSTSFAILLFVGSIGWCWPVFNELRSPVLVSPAEASIHPHIPRCQRLNRCRGKADSEIGKSDLFSSSTYAPSANRHVTGTSLGRESSARIVARESSSLRTRISERGLGERHVQRAEAEFEDAGPACITRRRGTARANSLTHPIQHWRTDKSC